MFITEVTLRPWIDPSSEKRGRLILVDPSGLQELWWLDLAGLGIYHLEEIGSPGQPSQVKAALYCNGANLSKR